MEKACSSRRDSRVGYGGESLATVEDLHYRTLEGGLVQAMSPVERDGGEGSLVV
jgi:hypothetical protein